MAASYTRVSVLIQFLDVCETDLRQWLLHPWPCPNVKSACDDTFVHWMS